MAKVGFIGLGNMGGPMAANLLKAQHQVVAFDLVEELVAKAVEDGASAAKSAHDVADCDVVISMLPAGRHVQGLYLGDDGLLAKMQAGSLVIDCSTIDAETSRMVAAAASERSIGMIDAPVSGGVGGAQAGTLTFIVGGEAAHLQQGRPILEAMGANIFHAGDSGAGQVAKICNNMLLAVLMAGTSEALALGVKHGLDPAVLSEVMQKSSGGNWTLNVYNPWPGVMEGVPSSRDYEGGFLVDLMIKDLGLAMEATQPVGASTPMGSLARSLYLMHKDGNDAGALDFSSIARLFSDKV